MLSRYKSELEKLTVLGMDMQLDLFFRSGAGTKLTDDQKKKAKSLHQ
jgi:hypothetical protein